MTTLSTDSITGAKTMKISKEAVWVNADRSKVVPWGSSDAAFLLVGSGGQISDEVAEQYGIKTTDAPEGPAPDNTAPHMYAEPVDAPAEEVIETKALVKKAKKKGK